MAMSRRARAKQQVIWIAAKDIRPAPSHPFYRAVNAVLDAEGFDAFVEERCAKFYAERLGRPSVPPGVYFRMLLVGYFEGIDSERGISWRCADSFTLHRFLGCGINEATPDHSTLSVIRKRIDLETHEEVFASNDVLRDLDEMGVRSYVSEPQRGRRRWEGKSEERDAVYANRRRIKGKRGRALMRRRGEVIERSFAHCYETGAMRRTHLKGHEKILKRLLIHVAGFNLGLMLRRLFGYGTARSLQDVPAGLLRALLGLATALRRLWIVVSSAWRLPETTSEHYRLILRAA